MFLKESPDHLETGCPESNETVKQNFFCVSTLGPHALDRRNSIPSFVPTPILWFLTGRRVHPSDVCPADEHRVPQGKCLLAEVLISIFLNY